LFNYKIIEVIINLFVNFPHLATNPDENVRKHRILASFFVGLIQLRLFSYRPRHHIIFAVVAAEHVFVLAEIHCQTGWSSLLSLLGRSD
jgi:hypothetical protein